MSTTATPAATLPMDAPKAKPRTRKVGKTASKPAPKRAAKPAPKVELAKPPVAKLRKASKPEGFELGFQIARKDGQPVLPKGKGGVRFESVTLGDDGKPEMVVWIPQKRWAKMGKKEILGAAFAPPAE
jgi:hypothetical protein